MKRCLVIILILVFALSAFAQVHETGEVSDLKNLTKLFVNAGSHFKDRARIEKEIKRAQIPNLVFTDNAAEAEMTIMFFKNDEALLLVTGKAVPRLIFEYSKDKKSSRAEMQPARIAAEFVKYYKQANKIR